MENYPSVSFGHVGLDTITDGLRLGDNVVWQVDDIDDFRRVVDPYIAQARTDGRTIVYVRFASHPPLIDDVSDIHVHEVDPTEGFESFATAVHLLASAEGFGAFYVFDCLTDLIEPWHSDLMVMNFFTVTCPHLYELDTVAFFALLRDRHTFNTIAGIRDTTQLLIDLHHVGGERYVHPLKVWGRHSPTMFLPHLLTATGAETITSSEATVRLFASQHRGSEPAEYWRSVVDLGWDALNSGDTDAQETVRRRLLAMLIGNQGRMVALAARHLTLSDLLAIAEREIGTGYIGGKSVGMLLARAILQHAPGDRFAAHIEPHDSHFIGSDVFFTYIIANGWWGNLVAQKVPGAYFTAGAELHELLGAGRFPPSIRQQLIHLLEYYGQSPIIVRSSSLLEDNFGNAFAGKYDSVFCVNRGTPDDRLRALEDAIRAVYASAMSHEALAYRRNRHLEENDEQMAVLVQRVSGDHYGDHFFPHAAGVGNSSNLYVFDPDIDPDAGMLRLVLGLGTRAVDRTVRDYAHIVTLDDPRRGRLIDADDLSRFSQRWVDVLSLSRNDLATVAVGSLTDTDIRTDWTLFASPDRHALRVLAERERPFRTQPLVIDFRGLLDRTDFAPFMRDVLATLSAAYDYPVDIEFTLNVDAAGRPLVSIVQCRPLQTRGLGPAIAEAAPDNPDSCLFSSNGHFMGGNVRLPIDWVVLVRPDAYLQLGQQDKYSVARLVGGIGKALKRDQVLLAGPGRWGTTTPALGVPAHFTELSHCAALIEYTYPAGDFRPELSYGSHFFQDIVESGIFYAALFDDRPDVTFHPERILALPNRVREVVPSVPDALVSVVHVARTDGLVLHSDVTSQRLVCG